MLIYLISNLREKDHGKKVNYQLVPVSAFILLLVKFVKKKYEIMNLIIPKSSKIYDRDYHIVICMITIILDTTNISRKKNYN